MNTRHGVAVPCRMFAYCRLGYIFLLLANSLKADPSWKGQLTSAAPGPFPILAPTVLEMKVSWKGMISAGTIRVEFAPPDVKKPGTYVVRSSAESIGAATLLFPFKTNYWTELDPVSLRPQLFHAVETDDKETVDTTVRFSPNRLLSEQVTKNLKTGKIDKSKRGYAFSPVFDIYSAMMFVRSQKLDVGDKFVLVVNPFGTAYLLRVQVQGRELHEGKNSIRLTMGMRKIDRKTQELLPYKKLKKDATLWLSDDAARVPLELRAAVFIGDVRATLTALRKP